MEYPIAKKTIPETEANKSAQDYNNDDKDTDSVQAEISHTKLNIEKPAMEGDSRLNKIVDRIISNNDVQVTIYKRCKTSSDIKSNPEIVAKEKLVVRSDFGYDNDPSMCIDDGIKVVEDTHTATAIKPQSQDQDTLRLLESDKKHMCELCKKRFKKKSHLDNHSLTHTGVKPYACDQCDKRFRDSRGLSYHKLIHTGEKPFVCGVCNASFNHKSNLNRHEIIHTGDKPYFCNVCYKSFTQRSVLKCHSRIHTGERPYGCNFCNKRFKQSAEVKNHSCINNEKRFTCEVCKNSYSRYANLKKHACLRTVVKPHTCCMCNEGFRSEYQLLKHMRKHDSKDRYACKVCDKRYSRKCDLKLHSRAHTLGIYDCDVCGEQFCDGSDLIKHRTRVHADGNEEHNEQAFHTPGDLTKHSLVHSHSLVCPVCKACFDETSHLKQHIVETHFYLSNTLRLQPTAADESRESSGVVNLSK